jgi:hypothetical protein
MVANNIYIYIYILKFSANFFLRLEAAEISYFWWYIVYFLRLLTAEKDLVSCGVT